MAITGSGGRYFTPNFQQPATPAPQGFLAGRPVPTVNGKPIGMTNGVYNPIDPATGQPLARRGNMLYTAAGQPFYGQPWSPGQNQPVSNGNAGVIPTGGGNVGQLRGAGASSNPLIQSGAWRPGVINPGGNGGGMSLGAYGPTHANVGSFTPGAISYTLGGQNVPANAAAGRITTAANNQANASQGYANALTAAAAKNAPTFPKSFGTSNPATQSAAAALTKPRTNVSNGTAGVIPTGGPATGPVASQGGSQGSASPWANRVTGEQMRRETLQGAGAKMPGDNKPKVGTTGQPTELSPEQVAQAENVGAGSSGGAGGGSGGTPAAGGVPGIPGGAGAPGVSASGSQNAPISPTDVSSSSAQGGAPGGSASDSFAEGGEVPDTGGGYASGGDQGSGGLDEIQNRVDQVYDYGREQHGLPPPPNSGGDKQWSEEDQANQTVNDKIPTGSMTEPTMQMYGLSGSAQGASNMRKMMGFANGGVVGDDNDEEDKASFPHSADKFAIQGAMKNDQAARKNFPGGLSMGQEQEQGALGVEDAVRNNRGLRGPNGRNLEGFAEGGVVDDGNQQGQSPPRMASYVMGADAMPPDQADALEQQADPQGQMDPTERKMRAIASQQDPQQAFGLLQSYRQKFDRYKQFARAAASGVPGKPPDPAAAAHAATQAFANIPDGRSVQFAPTQGGVTATVRKLGGKAKRYDDGGVVDTDNPVAAVDDQGDQSAGEGGSSFSLPDFSSWLGGAQSTFDTVKNSVGDLFKNIGKSAADAGNQPQNPSGEAAGEYGQEQLSPEEKALRERLGAQASGKPQGEQYGPGSPPDEEYLARHPELDEAGNPKAQSFDLSGLKDEGGPEAGQAGAANQPKPAISPETQAKLREWSAIANRLFPAASGGAQRQKFIQDRIAADEGLVKAQNTRLYGSQATADARKEVGMAGVNQRITRDQLNATIQSNAQAIKAMGPRISALAGVIQRGVTSGAIAPEDGIKRLQQLGIDMSQSQSQGSGQAPQQQEELPPGVQMMRNKNTGQQQLMQQTPQGLIPYVRAGR